MSALTLTVRDETTTGDVLRALEVQFEAERLTARELIATRVHQEVRERGARDAEAQTEVALRAFERGSVLLLVDDKQVDDLGAEVVLTPGSTVAFLQLVPLVGG